PAPRVPLHVGIGAHPGVELGSEDDVVAASAGQRLADDLLRLARGIDVGGVDEVDALVEGPMDDAHRFVVVGVAPGSEHHRSQAEGADLDAGASERAMVHWHDVTRRRDLHCSEAWTRTCATM